jgi:hypothetical protein
MGMADWLSRSPSEIDHDEQPLKEEFVINEVRKRVSHHKLRYGDKLRELARIIKADDWSDSSRDNFGSYWLVRDHLDVKNGFIFYDENRFVPDIDARSEILAKAHGAHNGKTRSAARIKESFWWPNWTKEIEAFVERCRVCKNSDRAKRTMATPLIPVELPEGPWKKIAIDLKGPLTGKFKYLLVIQDYY